MSDDPWMDNVWAGCAYIASALSVFQSMPQLWKILHHEDSGMVSAGTYLVILICSALRCLSCVYLLGVGRKAEAITILVCNIVGAVPCAGTLWAQHKYKDWRKERL